MHIMTPTSVGFAKLKHRLTDWDFTFPDRALGLSDACRFGHEYWIGSSQDGSVWGLALKAWDKREPLYVRVLLVAPPQRQVRPIQTILFRAYAASPLTDDVAEQICNSVPFSTYRSVRSYLPEAPEEWLDLPVEIDVCIEPCEHTFVCPSTLAEYTRNDFEGALAQLYAPRPDGMLLSYILNVRGAVPMLRYDIDWPLSRRGQDGPKRRSVVDGVLPWDREPDCSLLTVYQSVPRVGIAGEPSYVAKPTIRLSVGGLTGEAAAENWHRCARALRRTLRTTAHE
jgi:hypothetical protein